jgi:threonine aldolase
MKLSRSFASDNNAGVHPEILAAIAQANRGHVLAYGDDPFTDEAVAKFRAVFGPETDVFFTFGGTGANVIGLSAMLRPFEAVICSANAHIHVDECGAPEKLTGGKLLDLATPDGKLTVALIRPMLHGIGDVHHVQPKVVSISQPTEVGTVYTAPEIAEIGAFAHQNGLYLHMDGARISNAAAALNLPFREFTTDAGVDILSFGGAKNGMMYGEAVLCFNKALSPHIPYLRKQEMQLVSKMRFISAQFSALLSNDLWLRNARHANEMAQLLAAEVAGIPAVRITRPTQANAVFAIVPPAMVTRLTQKFFFYTWDEETFEVRWMTSFDTTPEDVHAFVSCIKEAAGG